MDVISEILSRTPVKSVCRFRCVSKAWQALISDATFLGTHKEPLPLLVVNSIGADEPRDHRDSPLMDLESNLNFYIMGAYKYRGHDLQLLDLDGNVIRVMKRAGTFLTMCSGGAVNGPAACVTLHHSTFNVIDLASGNVIATSKAENMRDYNALNSVFSYGVGCAIPSGNYKLVFLARSQACQVLTLQDGAEWRHAQPSPAQVFFNGYRQYSSVTINGVMRFFHYNWEAPQGDENYILCFHLESEEWKESIKGPVKLTDPYDMPEPIMTELNDTLCIVEWEELVTHVWLLIDPVDSIWVKTYTIPMAPATYVEMPLRMVCDNGEKVLLHCSPRRFTSTATRTLQDYDPLTGSHTHRINFRAYGLGKVGICRMDLKYVVSSKIFTMVEPEEFNLPLLLE